MTRESNVESTDSGAETSVDAATVATADGRGVPWRYLVVLPTAEISVAALAMASSGTLGPGHSVTAALGIFLIYATPVIGVLSFVGLILDGRGPNRRGEVNPRWRWYAGVALATAAVLAYHGTEEGALFGLWEPTVALALAMVPVGSAYFLRHHLLADRGL